MYVSPQNMLEFTEHRETNALNQVSVARSVLDPNTKQFMQLAFQHGAYCAGGFAALVARHTFFPGTQETLMSDVSNHLNRNRQVLPNNSSQYACTGKGDIDLFFPTSFAISNFYASDAVFNLLGSSAWSRSSALGLAREHFFAQGTEKVQVITKYVAPIKEQLSTFDVYNAAVAFNDNHMFVPVGWKELEKTRTLHVNRWNQFTATRVTKYMLKKGYTNLSSKTASEIYDKALEALKESAEMMAKGQVPSEKLTDFPASSAIRAFGVTTPRKLARRLHPYLSSFTNAQLLELSVLCPQGNYNEAFKMLINRGESWGMHQKTP